MSGALERARKEAQGSGNERARAWAAIAQAEALERIAVAQETQAAIARHYLDESGGEFDFEGPRTAEVRSPLLMDVAEGADDGATTPSSVASLPPLTWRELGYLAVAIRAADGDERVGAFTGLADSLYTALREAQGTIPAHLR